MQDPGRARAILQAGPDSPDNICVCLYICCLFVSAHQRVDLKNCAINSISWIFLSFLSFFLGSFPFLSCFLLAFLLSWALLWLSLLLLLLYSAFVLWLQDFSCATFRLFLCLLQAILSRLCFGLCFLSLLDFCLSFVSCLCALCLLFPFYFRYFVWHPLCLYSLFVSFLTYLPPFPSFLFFFLSFLCWPPFFLSFYLAWSCFCCSWHDVVSS